MFLIGERINGTFSDIREALRDKDKTVIQAWVKKQAGADALDVNAGTGSDKPVAAMEWLVSAIREISGLPLSIDTTKNDVMEAGLKISGQGRSIINSANAEPEKLKSSIELAKKYGAKLIALTMDRSGVPQDAGQRVELAGRILIQAQEAGMNPGDIFIDPILLPINVAQNQLGEILDAAAQIKLLSDPPCRVILGLSNLSQKTKFKSLLNRTFLAMAAARGLDSAILDVTDNGLIDSLAAAELILNRQVYCDDFTESFRKK